MKTMDSDKPKLSPQQISDINRAVVYKQHNNLPLSQQLSDLNRLALNQTRPQGREAAPKQFDSFPLKRSQVFEKQQEGVSSTNNQSRFPTSFVHHYQTLKANNLHRRNVTDISAAKLFKPDQVGYGMTDQQLEKMENDQLILATSLQRKTIVKDQSIQSTFSGVPIFEAGVGSLT